jgi:hypothetical protein
MQNPVCYLDTNHLSRLARSPSEPDCTAVLRLLSQRKVSLAFSVIHMVELSDPTFASFASVCRLLDSVAIAWAVLPPALFDREVEAAFAKAVGAPNRKVVVFYDSPVHALNDPNLEGGPPSAALEALRSNAHLRDILLDEADEHAQDYDAMKGDAAAVRRPLEPLLSRIRDAQLRQTPAGLHLPQPLDPRTILDRAGGLSGFPSYQVYQSLNLTRLKDAMYKSTRNDILDEWHAIYAPYADVAALDRTTVGRLRSTRLPISERVTRSLKDVPVLLEQWTGAAI